MRRRNVQVFVSYTWSKNGFGAVNDFSKGLQRELGPGIKVFQDKMDLPKKGPLEARLQKALNESDVLLVLVSGAWLRSKWCRWEFTKFKKARQDRRPRIVPVLWWEIGTPESTVENEIAQELAAIDVRDNRHGVKQSMSASDKKIAKLAKRVVKSIPPEKRRKAAKGADDRDKKYK
jgi:hypothetical protein